MSAKCGGRGLEIAGFKTRCSISELHVVIKFFRAHLLFVLNVIFAGPLKENEQRQKMAQSFRFTALLVFLFFQNEKKN